MKNHKILKYTVSWKSKRTKSSDLCWIFSLEQCLWSNKAEAGKMAWYSAANTEFRKLLPCVNQWLKFQLSNRGMGIRLDCNLYDISIKITWRRSAVVEEKQPRHSVIKVIKVGTIYANMNLRIAINHCPCTLPCSQSTTFKKWRPPSTS